MHLKDYYRILELEQSATQEEIKKAYRKLALQYHPDKRQNDAYATLQFTEIKEAYEVLTNPAKKYYYLQQRWYNQSFDKRKFQGVITPVTLLKQVLELDKYVSTLDVHRMDKEGLYSYIGALLSDNIIEKLNTFNDITINKAIIAGILNCASSLPVKSMDALQDRLLHIKADEATVKKINTVFQSIHKTHYKEKYRVWVILLIVLLISLMIFFLSE